MVPGPWLVLQHSSYWCGREPSCCNRCVSHLLLQLAVPADAAPAWSGVVHHFCLMRDACSLFPAWWLTGCDAACDWWFQSITWCLLAIVQSRLHTSNTQGLFSTDIRLSCKWHDLELNINVLLGPTPGACHTLHRASLPITDTSSSVRFVESPGSSGRFWPCSLNLPQSPLSSDAQSKLAACRVFPSICLSIILHVPSAPIKTWRGQSDAVHPCLGREMENEIISLLLWRWRPGMPLATTEALNSLCMWESLNLLGFLCHPLTITWMEEPGRLQSMGSQRVGHDWGTLSLSLRSPLCQPPLAHWPDQPTKYVKVQFCGLSDSYWSFLTILWKRTGESKCVLLPISREY